MTVVVPGAYGKPRPALVVQNDAVSGIDSTLVCLLTTNNDHRSMLRFPVAPSIETGLRFVSTVMVDKVHVVPTVKCGPVIGALNGDQMDEIDARLAFVLGLSR